MRTKIFLIISILILIGSCTQIPNNGSTYIAAQDCAGYVTIQDAERMNKRVKDGDQQALHEIIYSENTTYMLYINNKVRIVNGGADYTKVMGLDSVSKGSIFYIETKKIKPAP